MRSPQTIGLDTAIPGTGVFQRTLRPLARSQSATAPCPSATPAAFAPRNAGQGDGFSRGATSFATDGVGFAGAVAAVSVDASFDSTVIWPPWFTVIDSIIPPRPPNETVRF